VIPGFPYDIRSYKSFLFMISCEPILFSEFITSIVLNVFLKIIREGSNIDEQ